MAAGSGAVAKLIEPLLLSLGAIATGVIFALLVHACRPEWFAPAPNAAIIHADSIVQHADTVFIHDTSRITATRTVYHTIRAGIVADSGRVGPDTVLRFVRAADTVVASDSTAIENCARLVEAQRKLIATLQPPPPKLQYFVEPLYSVTDGAIDVRGGAEYRLFGQVQAIAAVQVGPNPGLFVGARITFR